MRATALFLAVLVFSVSAAAAEQPDIQQPDIDAAVRRGYDFILNKAYVPPDLNEEIFAELWQVWPEPLRSEAEQAAPEQRREMAFSRYGLTVRPNDDSGKPLQYVVDKSGNWSMNCFACHGGKVRGEVIPGAPNTHLALQTLMDDVRSIKLLRSKRLTAKDIGGTFFPYGGTNGTTNAVMFGVALSAFRDPDLNVLEDVSIPDFVHHDMDAPAWWNFHRKDRLYADGFAEKGHRGLMQFMMTRNNGPEQFRAVEADFRDIYQYIDSLRPPKWPFAIDRQLARRGATLFNTHCADCHGTYGTEAAYPQVTVDIEEVGTDRVRLDALTVKNREDYGKGWFTHYGKQHTVGDPKGYLAPPLDGIWASAPYFHNGSVPTLWHVLHPNDRPMIWKRSDNGYDSSRVGLEVETYDRFPRTIRSREQIREYFDTRKFGKNASGHTFPDVLTEAEKQAVLEYLKTL